MDKNDFYNIFEQKSDAVLTARERANTEFLRCGERETLNATIYLLEKDLTDFVLANLECIKNNDKEGCA